MIRINLIPHRAEYRKQQIIEYIIVFVLAILISVTVSVFINTIASDELSGLQDDQAQLQSRNKMLSKKIGELRNLDSLRDEVEGKLQIVDELQAGRFRSLLTLNGIASVMPQNTWLAGVIDDGGSVRLEGFGESSQAIANFMRALEASDIFSNVQLSIDREAVVEGVTVRSFSLSFHRLTLAEQAVQDQSEREQ